MEAVIEQQVQALKVMEKVPLGGVRVPIGGVRVGGEIRWQGGSGKLPANQDFAGSKIDLGGFNYLFVFNIPF